MKEWLHELAVALGLVEPPRLQPVPIKSAEQRRLAEQRRAEQRRSR